MLGRMSKAVHDVPFQAASLDIWDKKYRLKDKNSVNVDGSLDETYLRVAKALSDIEDEDIRSQCFTEFKWALENGAIPAGRIMSNAGALAYKPATSTINCTVSAGIEDSMDGILHSVHQAGLTLKAGCGIGYEFSTLRPDGAFVDGAGASTSGPLSFMDIFDKMCFTISSAGGRRGAQMATFDIHHPDILNFIKAKREDGRLRQFNLSCLITSDFMEAVKNDADWKLSFPISKKDVVDGVAPEGVETLYREFPMKSDSYVVREDGLVLCRVYKTMKAKQMMDVMMASTYDYAEPGFILIDEYNDKNNNWWVENIRSTNPCVRGNTIILTRKGYVEIQSVVGQSLEIWNGFEWSLVEIKETGQNQDMLRIELSDGSSLDSTYYHKFHLKGKEVIAEDLIKGDSLIKNEWPVIAGDSVLPDAYAQGFFSGDGWYSYDGDVAKSYIGLYGEKKKLAKEFSPISVREYNISGGYEGTDTTQTKLYLYFGKNGWVKSFVPSTEYDVNSRLEWLSGIFDSDGCVVSSQGKDKNAVSCSVQVSSKDRNFLMNIKYLLNTLGTTGSVAPMKDCFRLSISPSNLKKLQNIGLSTKRLDISNNNPNREAPRFVKVIDVYPVDMAEKVYCFTDHKNHTGIFNGIITGQCGEQGLPDNGSCLLGSINLTKFVDNPFQKGKSSFDWPRFRKVISIFTRMLDNVVEINGLPLPEQRHEIEFKRRHGMGFLGLGSMLTMLGIKYGSDESIEMTRQITYILAKVGFEAGLSLAKEKGPAPIMDTMYTVTHEMLCKRPEMSSDGFQVGDKVTGKLLWAKYSRYMNKFIESGDEYLIDDLIKYGCRFTHHSSIAPTGTISLSLANNASNGIEPSFAHHYSRNIIREGKNTKEKVNVFSFELLAYRHFINSEAMPSDANSEGDLPEYFISADDVTPKQHIDIQAASQEWIDSSISKTANVPTDIDYDEFKDIYMYAYEKGLKGCTTFRYNPEAFSGVLVREDDLSNTEYEFTLDDGSVVTVKGNDEIEYDGEMHTAANLFDALKEGYYGKL